MFRRYDQFIFIDSDNAVVRSEIFDMLHRRAKDFDFLATYGFGKPSSWMYESDFNSGLMFVRTLPEVDYDELPKLMWKLNTNNDQHVISKFVRMYYRRWDSLSLRWHCRYLFMKHNNIHPSNCLTFHAREPYLSELFQAANRSLLTM